MLNVRALKHDFRFRNGTLIANSTIEDVELRLAANQISTLTLKLSHDVGIQFTDNIDVTMGYQDSDILPINTPYPTLSLGSTGANVTLLQNLLKEHGFYLIAVDTTFGSGTDAAVRAFQTVEGLTVDGIVGNSTWTALFKNSSYVSMKPGRFYVDSFQRKNEYFVAECIALNYAANPKVKQTYTGLSMNQVVNAVATDSSLKPVTSSEGTFLVGTAPTNAVAVAISSETSKLDAAFQAGTKYGYFNFAYSDKLYSHKFSKFWNEVAVPVILDGDCIEYEKNTTTIDTVRIIDSIKWKPNSIFTPATISYVEYGDTRDLQSEGFQENVTSASNRLWGYAIEETKNVRNLKVKTYGRLGATWLPGRVISVGNQDGTSSRWVIRSHTWNYGSGGFTSTFNLQYPAMT